MWPIQTLTLLLCLTDEEQLFAQRSPQDPVPVVIEMKETENILIIEEAAPIG